MALRHHFACSIDIGSGALPCCTVVRKGHFVLVEADDVFSEVVAEGLGVIIRLFLEFFDALLRSVLQASSEAAYHSNSILLLFVIIIY